MIRNRYILRVIKIEIYSHLGDRSAGTSWHGSSSTRNPGKLSDRMHPRVPDARKLRGSFGVRRKRLFDRLKHLRHVAQRAAPRSHRSAPVAVPECRHCLRRLLPRLLIYPEQRKQTRYIHIFSCYSF